MSLILPYLKGISFFLSFLFLQNIGYQHTNKLSSVSFASYVLSYRHISRMSFLIATFTDIGNFTVSSFKVCADVRCMTLRFGSSDRRHAAIFRLLIISFNIQH
jgi:hypothetical protein